jgi:hypothetical protein
MRRADAEADLKYDHGPVGKIDYRAAYALLFPKGERGWVFPKESDWRRLKKPFPSVPIDHQVWLLTQSDHSPRVERNEFLDRDPLYGWEPLRFDPVTGKPSSCCPFLMTRTCVVLAASLASEEVYKRSKAKNSADCWKRIDAIASKFEYELTRFDESADFYFFGDGPDDTPTRKLMRLELFEAVKNARLFAIAEKNRLVPPYEKGDVWGQCFVMSLGYTWFVLTGCEPKGTAFAKFLDSAYESLGGGGMKWTEHIARARGRNDKMSPFHRWGGHTIYTKAPHQKGTP